MELGAHIAAYLLCEPFIDGGAVLDLFPPDERGARRAAESARFVVVSRGSLADHERDAVAGLSRIACSPEAPPLSSASFDLVFVTGDWAQGFERQRFDALVRAARALVKPSGIVSVRIPNPKAPGIGSAAARDIPDFFEFERELRRHFPHVALYAQQPLHGAVLSPLGRQVTDDDPLLDDRLLPEGGEIPTCFAAFCSHRYHKLDETVIARLPFRLLIEEVRSRVERAEGALAVARGESAQNEREVERLGRVVRDLEDRVSELGRAGREVADLSARAEELERQLERRGETLVEAERKADSEAARAADLEEQLHVARREGRQAERLEEDLARAREQAVRERDDWERERREILEQARAARAEVLAKQRQVDDVREELAGIESETADLREESAKQRRELVSSRERIRRLETDLQEAEIDRSAKDELEVSVDRLRARFASDKARLEERLAEQAAERERLEDRLGLESAERETAEARLAEKVAETARLEARLAEQVAETARLEARLADRTAETARLEERLAERTAETARLEEALERAKEHLSEVEGESAERVEDLLGSATALTEERDALAAELDRLRPAALSSQSARNRAMEAEALLEDRDVVARNLEARLAEEVSRREELSGDLEAASAALAEAEERAAQNDRRAEALLAEKEEELARVTAETESEILSASEDLEVELRAAIRELEARQGEVWELREEIVRLRAQVAASAASATRAGKDVDFQKTLAEQESLIGDLREERDRLRRVCERQLRSLEIRKKNIKLLVELFRKERSGGWSEQEAELDEEERERLGAAGLDIGGLLFEAGGEIDEELLGELEEEIGGDGEDAPDGDDAAD